jgi:ribosomal protein S18 acetylase RimI-like enzyme
MILPFRPKRHASEKIYNSLAMNTSHLRPFRIAHDLPAVTDLLEICFAREGDADSLRYISSMRRASQNRRFLEWASTATNTSLPLRGFVWEEDGRIVGNVNVATFRSKGGPIYMIANVAVHPDYRRRGIARMLVFQAMQQARERGAASIWLQVRDDNQGAIQLYRQLGFVARAHRTIWAVEPAYQSFRRPAGITITRRQVKDWPLQKRWLEDLYPQTLNWFFPFDWHHFSPWPWHVLWRSLQDVPLGQWRVSKNGELQGVLSWAGESSLRDNLWLAAPRQADDQALTALLCHVQKALSNRLELRLDHPWSIHQSALELAGFRALRSLLWMQAAGKNNL